MHLKKLQITLSSLLLVLLSWGCVSVPQASVELSGELTRMIDHSRQTHLNLLDGYTAKHKAEIENFLTEKYVPSFTANFVAESGVLANIQSAETDEEKGAEILEFAEAAFPIIDEQRRIYMEVVNEMDQVIRREIEAHYQNMLNVNQALTAHLASAADVVQTRQHLQQQLGLNTENSLLSLNRINETMEKMLDIDTKAEDIPELLNEFKRKLKG